jgi:hypothetical protein
VVSGGSIALISAASLVHVGLPITADIETLPAVIGLKDGSFGQGRAKNVNKLWLRVLRSAGIFAGPDVDHLMEVKARSTEPYGSPPALRSEEIQLMVSPSWADGAPVVIRQEDPLPLTVVNITAEIAIGG